MTEGSDIRERFLRALLPGETVIWVGRPGQGLLLARQDRVLIPFAIAWCGLVAWTFALPSARPPHVVVFAIVLALIGAYILFGRFVLDAWVRRRIVYAVTDRCALVLFPRAFGGLVAVDRTGTTDVDLHDRGDGTGTIVLGPEPLVRMNRFGRWVPSLERPPRFVAIRDAQAVFDVLRQPVARSADEVATSTPATE